MLSSTSARLFTWVLLAQCLLAQDSSSRSSSVLPSTFSFASAASSSSVFSRNATVTSSVISSSTTGEAVTAIVGPAKSGAVTTGTATTSSQPRQSNTRPCNGYTEFCERKFSNISMVVAHNSPFVRAHNAASNQIYPVLTQLNDGIRGLQFETQKPNSSSAIRLCHTSCDILDVGTLESYLATVKTWLEANPYEVIAIIMGNNNGQTNRNAATDYIQPFQAAGLLPYLWTPPSTTLNLTQWPTLAEMILKNKRVVVTLDYGADQSSVPWLLDEFSYMWETPFSPTDPAFPCTQQRPPNQDNATSRERMYMANHNLNIEISLSGMSGILIPAYSLLGEVNAVSGNGSLGLNVQTCENMWGRAPNFLLVDYYNFGNVNGSVFEVAAQANGVTYNAGSCCGSGGLTGAAGRVGMSLILAVCGLIFSVVLVVW